MIDQFGGTEQLKMQTVATPELKPNQVLVHTKSVSVNPIDCKIRSGAFKKFKLPAILGFDVAGTITAVGADVTDYQVGDAVFAETAKSSTYAEEVAVNVKDLAKKPNEITFNEAAALPMASLTAWQAVIDTIQIRPGEKLFINGGAGGVGQMAIQFAHNAGAYVATTASKTNAALLESLGADEVIDYHTDDFRNRLFDYDAVLDLIGGVSLVTSYQILKPGGRLVSLVGKPDANLAKKYEINASHFSSHTDGKLLGEIGDQVVKGRVRVTISKIFEFSQAGVVAAQTLSESGHADGKIVIQFA
ncbi:NADPH quinone reductase [Lactobacillus selangorensis]|uniref:NADPH quinone reductase n=2 Tax=Lactobacillus selangorensis TaxID=81857 RepID=A0A0R2G5A8_9LACO|nr:NADPH quinone reductase [Lactobacillus selangorensis]KRN32599.1 NADPH quinone reductase [Lactobacillus selangorensis]